MPQGYDENARYDFEAKLTAEGGLARVALHFN